MKVFVLLLLFSLCVGRFTLASAEDDVTGIDEEIQEDVAVEDESENISLLDILAHSLLGEEDDDDEIKEDEAEHDVDKREIDVTTDTDVKTDEDSEDKSLNDPFLLGWKVAPKRRRQSFRRRGVSLYGLKSTLLKRLLFVPPRRQLSRPRPIIIRVTPVVTRRRRPLSIFGKKFLFDEEEDEHVDEETSSDQIESDPSLARLYRRRNPIRTRITVRRTTPRRQQSLPGYLGLQRRQPLRVRVKLNDEPTTKDEF